MKIFPHLLALSLLCVSFQLISLSALAQDIRYYSTKQGLQNISKPQIEQILRDYFDFQSVRYIGVQVAYQDDAESGAQDFLPKYLLAFVSYQKRAHHVQVVKLELDEALQVVAVLPDYQLTEADVAQQIQTAPQCPDHATEVMVFAPNPYEIEQNVTTAVASTAEAMGYKTVSLLVENATHANFMAYARCPNLKAVFYDGDGCPQLITAYDNPLYAKTLGTLSENFNVTHVWVACEAFNDPMKSAMIRKAKVQKLITGINDLEIGPSDNAGACTMQEALRGKNILASFKRCYNSFDVEQDFWGRGGNGTSFVRRPGSY